MAKGLFKVSVLNIGDELLIGQTINTNASWIGKRCTEAGARVNLNIVVPDDEAAIVSALESAMKVSDLVLVTGGLGPTHDDITKKVLAGFFNDILIPHPGVTEKLKSYLERRGREFLAIHEHQALMPANAVILDNDNGSAPGMMWKKEGVVVISMPGVPAEMRFIMEKSVLPLLEELMASGEHEVMLYNTLLTAGIAESSLAQKIGDHTLLFNGSLAYLPSYKGVRLRLGISADGIGQARREMEEALEKLRVLAGRHMIGEGDDDFVSFISSLLQERGLTVSTAESCTGGKLSAALTDIPGSSSYFKGGIVSYSNESKIAFLDVAAETIDAYGAVSEEAAVAMCSGAKARFGADYAISITGIAGPGGGSPEKPVGTVWVGIATPVRSFARLYSFGNSREINRELAVHYALYSLYEEINGARE